MNYELGIGAEYVNNSELNTGTPYLLIDGVKMERNVLKMAEVAGGNGVALRPHVKTHKIPVIARKQLEAGAAGITVAKLSEAEVMADGGIEDIFIAYPLVTEEKIRQAVQLGERVRIVVGVDSNANTSVGWYYGRLDELRIYSRALSGGEIMTLAN